MTTHEAAHEAAMDAYERASWAYEDAVNTGMPQAVQGAAEQVLIAATLNLTQTHQQKPKEAKKMKKRDPRWGFTGGADYPDHGEIGTYTTQKCRCKKCRLAWTVYCKELHATRAERREIPHGTLNGYHNYDCRCDLCVQADRDDYRNKHSALTYLSRMRNRGEANV